MNLDLVNLVLLQKLDTEIDTYKRVEEEGPQRIAQLDAELEAAEEKVRQAKALEQEYAKQHRELERELAETEEKLKSNQARQLQVKTNEEYRALLKENEYLRKSNTAREDEILTLMDRLEKAKAENQELEGWIEQERTRIGQEKAAIEKEIEASRLSLDDLYQKRDALAKDIPHRSISLYKRMYSGRNGRAVASIVDGVCAECHMQIPPQQFNELQRNESLMTCPNCQRIIFWGEHQDFEDIS